MPARRGAALRRRRGTMAPRANEIASEYSRPTPALMPDEDDAENDYWRANNVWRTSTSSRWAPARSGRLVVNSAERTPTRPARGQPASSPPPGCCRWRTPRSRMASLSCRGSESRGSGGAWSCRRRTAPLGCERSRRHSCCRASSTPTAISISRRCSAGCGRPGGPIHRLAARSGWGISAWPPETAARSTSAGLSLLRTRGVTCVARWRARPVIEAFAASPLRATLFLEVMPSRPRGRARRWTRRAPGWIRPRRAGGEMRDTDAGYWMHDAGYRSRVSRYPASSIQHPASSSRIQHPISRISAGIAPHAPYTVSAPLARGPGGAGAGAAAAAGAFTWRRPRRSANSWRLEVAVSSNSFVSAARGTTPGPAGGFAGPLGGGPRPAGIARGGGARELPI